MDFHPAMYLDLRGCELMKKLGKLLKRKFIPLDIILSHKYNEQNNENQLN